MQSRNMPEKENGIFNDCSEYKQHLFDQYKLYVDSAEKNSDRRRDINTFFLTLMTFISGLTGYFLGKNINYDKFIIIGILTPAIMSCVYWYRILDSHKKLSSAKFYIINKIEKKLPLAVFTKEWSFLNEQKYSGQTYYEKLIPITFLVILLSILIMSIYHRCF